MIDALLLSTVLPACRSAYAAEYSRQFPLPEGYVLADLIDVSPATPPKLGMLAAMVMNSAVFGFVAVSADTILISFRGTQIRSEWIEDFEAAPVAHQNGPGHCHSGFQEIYQYIRAKVWSILGQYWSKPHVIVCGHSLGGVLAVLCAFDIGIHRKPLTKPDVYTLEAPAVAAVDIPHFTSAFKSGVQAACGTIIRVENQYDLVPRLPLMPLYVKEGTILKIKGGHGDNIAVAHSLDSVEIGLKAA